MDKFPKFNFEGQDVRVAVINQGYWWTAADVHTFLGYSRADNMLRYLSEDEKMVTPHEMRAYHGLHHRSVLISESGLYKLVMRSDKPAARRFQDWVTREVLPALRKDGMYVMGEEKVKTGARVKSSGPGLLRPATSSRPLALQHQGEDGGCILGCPTCETRSTIAACCGVWHTLGQNLEEDQAP